MTAKIAPTALVNDNAKLGKNVIIGDYAIIGENVVIGDNTEIMHHSTIDKNSTIGKNCKIYSYAVIGTDPQDITFNSDDQTFVEIGNNNVIREFVTINRGTKKGGSYTRIGDNNYFMIYSHVAHDCQIGNNTQLVNGATLAGHVEIEDFAVVGAFSSVHQFARIGRNSYVGGYTIVLQDILPYAKISQTRDNYNLYGTNSIGMLRNGMDREYIHKVRDLFDIFFKSDLNTSQAVEKIKEKFNNSEEAEILIDFISKTKRGFLKTFGK